MINYFYDLKHLHKGILLFKKAISEWAFNKKGKAILYFYCFAPRYKQEYDRIESSFLLCEFLDIEEFQDNISYVKDVLNHLKNPEMIQTKEKFENFLHGLSSVILECKRIVDAKLQFFNSEEKERLNEAIHCFKEECYYSSVAMSVSTIEFRLLGLMKKANPEANLGKLTLGQLIGEYLDNKQSYQQCIPTKHEDFLNLCNTYRIFSVHPKKEKINKRVCNSILNLTFEFLLDKQVSFE